MHTSKAGDDKTQHRDDATVAINLEDAQQLKCVLKEGQGSTFTVRSILKKRLAERRTFAGDYSVESQE